MVEASTRRAYREFEADLRGLGLVNDTREGAHICRWITPEGHVVDVMPTGEDLLGFTNRWYPMAVAAAQLVAIDDGLSIKIPPAPVFLGTKWEAFRHRGAGDVLGSHDLEDVISVVAGRPEIVGEVRAARPELRDYLAMRAEEFLGNELAPYAVQGALPDAVRIPDLVARTLERIRQLGTSS